MLAVDIGNTFTQIASFSGDAVHARRSFPTCDLDKNALIPAFGDMKTAAGAKTLWVASVNPDAGDIVNAAAARCGLERHFIDPATDCIMPHALTTPDTTGVDRLLSAMAVGARHFSAAGRSGGYVVVQCGTAATVDWVDADGAFRGGYILPGPKMWLKGMSIAARIPDYSGELPDWQSAWIGDNTRDAVRNGMHAALPVAVATAARLVNTKEGGFVAGGDGGTGLPVVVTGGWGEAIIPHISAKCVYDRDLLLHGIRLFAERKRAIEG